MGDPHEHRYRTVSSPQQPPADQHHVAAAMKVVEKVGRRNDPQSDRGQWVDEQSCQWVGAVVRRKPHHATRSAGEDTCPELCKCHMQAVAGVAAVAAAVVVDLVVAAVAVAAGVPVALSAQYTAQRRH